MTDLNAKDAALRLELSPLAPDPGAPSDEYERGQKLFGLEVNRALLQKRLRQSNEMMSLRKRWSMGLLICVVSIVFLNFVMLFLLGLNIMSFPDPFIFPAFLGQSLLQIVGMGFVIVQFLFHKDSFGLQD
jgi:hypothetical protein